MKRTVAMINGYFDGALCSWEPEQKLLEVSSAGSSPAMYPPNSSANPLFKVVMTSL